MSQVAILSQGSAPPTPFAPNEMVQIFDDFVGFSNLDRAFSLGWTLDDFNSSPVADPAHPGIVGNAEVSGDVGYIALLNDEPNTDGQFALGGGVLSVFWIIKVATLSSADPRYILRVGLGDTVTASDQANGIYFEYSDDINSGNWVGKTASASVRSTANSAVAVTNTDYVKLGMTVNAGATSVSFFVNSVEIANSPLATNIPTASITPFITFISTVGTIAENSVIADLFYLTQTLTSPR